MTAAGVWLAHSVPMLKGIPIIYGGLIPDMNLFNLRAEASHAAIGTANASEIMLSYIGMATLWGIIYSIGLVSLAAILFNRRDLK